MSKLSDELEAELKRRIKQDMEPRGKWDEKIWKDQALGDYYGPELFIIHLLVGGCTETVLATYGTKMSQSGWAQLQADVKADTKPPVAVNAMVDAAIRTESDKAESTFQMAVSEGLDRIQLAISVVHFNARSTQASREQALKLESLPSLSMAYEEPSASSKKGGKKQGKEKK